MPVIQPDGVVYLAVAKHFQATGSPFDPLFHPLYPICIALAQPLIGDWETSGRLVSAFFGALVILPAFALARGIVGRQAALLAAVFTAVHPRLVQSSASELCEATYTFVLVCGVLAARYGLVGGARALIPFAGLCFGLSYLVRPEGALYLIGFVLVVVFMVMTARARAAAVLPWVGAAVLVFAVVVLPYVWYLAEAWGHVTLSGKIDHNLGISTGVATAASPLPLRVLENILLFQKYAVPDLLPWILLLLVLPGMLARGRTAGWLGRDGVLLVAALPPFASLAFHVEPRIFLPILPFILPFAALGTLWVAVTLTDARQAARWIAETQPRDAVLLDRKPLIAFYSERRWVPLPRIGPEELLAAARHAGARLVVLDSREFLFDRPGLVPLLWGPPPPGLDVLRDFDAAPADRLRILVVNERG